MVNFTQRASSQWKSWGSRNDTANHHFLLALRYVHGPGCQRGVGNCTSVRGSAALCENGTDMRGRPASLNDILKQLHGVHDVFILPRNKKGGRKQVQVLLSAWLVNWYFVFVHDYQHHKAALLRSDAKHKQHNCFFQMCIWVLRCLRLRTCFSSAKVRLNRSKYRSRCSTSRHILRIKIEIGFRLNTFGLRSLQRRQQVISPQL